MNKTEMSKKITNVLKKLGYAPRLDEDGDVYFRYQLKWVYMFVMSDDEERHPLINISLADIYELNNDDKDEKVGALIICNDLTQEKELTKVTVNLKYGIITAQSVIVYTGEKSLELYLEKLFASDEFGDVSSEFRRRMTYLREE